MYDMHTYSFTSYTDIDILSCSYADDTAVNGMDLQNKSEWAGLNPNDTQNWDFGTSP
jgi:hypothetical protein